MPDTLRTYLEFRNSNWYAYWDTDSAPVNYRQELSAWHIDHPNDIFEFPYKPLKARLASGEFIKDIMHSGKDISEKDALDLQAAAICFISGVESKYPL